ncbi:MAG: UDP-N-acetylglucosamine 2-epimerase (non-hydrolyzing) [Planctomycetes bacterium]|nr:UDP-N-acetylglucosamine 2-epimerase (non-hydrolyzing) [Planctomycetota bacterium]
MIKIANVCGARPNFMKIAPLMRVYRAIGGVEPLPVHTGQHYDEQMNHWFFEELEIPPPDINLEVGSASHAVQTAEIMKRFETFVLDERPDAVLVVGDVNSTAACALVAAKLNIPVIHVEAGLRSFDRTMPEEINRVVTDALSDLLFVTEPSGVTNLQREGVGAEKVHLVGNVMIDTLLRFKARSAESDILEKLGVESGKTVVLTLHRPANVDDPVVFGRILDAVEHVVSTMPVVFPMHPRTRARITESPVGKRMNSLSGLKVVPPLGYLDFLHLMSEAACVLTDSGGIQEETTILGVPCLTLRENTERPITIDEGTNRLVGSDPAVIIAAFQEAVSKPVEPKRPHLWDGRAAERIVDIILSWFESRRGGGSAISRQLV